MLLFAVELKPHNRWCGFKALRERWQAHAQKSLLRPVLLVDEAQEMAALVLAELRLLAMGQLDTEMYLTVVLSGDSRLLERFRQPELRPLESRIRTRLPLDPAERELSALDERLFFELRDTRPKNAWPAPPTRASRRPEPMLKRISPEELRRLHNNVPITAVIDHLGLPWKVRAGYFRFLCPLCFDFDTATHPRTHLARCFRCRRNFNPIDLIMVDRSLSFLETVRYLQQTVHLLRPPDFPQQEQEPHPR